jgi:uncharacterized protein
MLLRTRLANLEELRARIAATLERTALRAPAPPPPVDTDLPFAAHATPSGTLHVRAQQLSAAHRTGRAPLLAAKGASAELLSLLALDPEIARCDPRRALYLDTETTGLHGGTGTVAFLVGLGYWGEEGGLLVEQLLVRALGEEAPMLELLAERIANASMLVTFNGKSFDLPLLRTRFALAKIAMPEPPPHLDLVHVARRVHRGRVKSARSFECRLTTIEREVLGFERFDDTPSGEVSACYLQFLRTGDARPLLGVIEHNAWDVVAMVALVGLYGEPILPRKEDGGREPGPLAAEDLVGVAQTFKRAGDLGRALEAANAALEQGGGPESMRVRADIAKARGDRAQALADFEELARSVDCAKVRLELAKLYEHFVREPARALPLVEQGVAEPEPRASKRERRLKRKLERARQAEVLDIVPNGRRRRTL